MARAYLGLGSNQGDRRALLQQALGLLGAYGTIKAISPLYESAALLPENAPAEWDRAFYNIVVSFETERPPLDLLEACQQIEKQLDRVKIGHWSPRTIDIDILLYDSEILESESLTLPHKEALKRDFAMLPLADIAPDLRWPTTKQTVQSHIQKAGFQPHEGLQRTHDSLTA